MTTIAETAFKPVLTPAMLQGRPLVWQLAAFAIGIFFLTLSSYIEVPMFPVPITMQTFAVTLTGALYGWRPGGITITAWLVLPPANTRIQTRPGGITITAWLVQAALGLPVLASGAAGIQYFFGPTGGYLLAFPIAGAFMGWLAEQGWDGNRMILAFTAMLMSNGLCLLLGAAWLSTMIGIEKALVWGVFPFLIGGFLKAALGAVMLRLLTRSKSK